MRQYLLFLFLIPLLAHTQTGLRWQNVDSLYGPLPSSVQIYRTTDPLEGAPNVAYYLVADLKDRKLQFTADTTYNRRLTPSGFYAKNGNPLVVVNCTFFSFNTHQNLNAVVRNGKLVSYNAFSNPGRGRDTGLYFHPFRSAIGITKDRKADVAWLYTDSSRKRALAMQMALPALKDSVPHPGRKEVREHTSRALHGRTYPALKKWKVRTAVGGGPVLLQGGKVAIANEEERMFAGKAAYDKHPRTAMGYTADGRLIILVVQGRAPRKAEGATLLQEAQILQELGCVEALNLDGGGSSCLLVNGKETITPSDKGHQRAVPAVFLIR